MVDLGLKNGKSSSQLLHAESHWYKNEVFHLLFFQEILGEAVARWCVLKTHQHTSSGAYMTLEKKRWKREFRDHALNLPGFQVLKFTETIKFQANDKNSDMFM